MFALLSSAIEDSRLAQALLNDAGYRRWLHDDPSAALRVFEVAAPAFHERRDAPSVLSIVTAAA
jgi:hypothetical protein